MPSHIYYRVGRYADAERVNEQAALVDEAYIAACKAAGEYHPAGYYGHNIHTSSGPPARCRGAIQGAIDAASPAGQGGRLDAYNLAVQVPVTRGVLRLPAPIVTQLRFEKWDAVLAEPPPPKALVIDRAVSLYARGVAFAAKGDLKSAEAARGELDAVISVSDFSRYDAFAIPAKPIAALGLALLDAEVARAKGDKAGAVAEFRAAYAMMHDLPYTEPPWWHQPVAHLLGAALLDNHQPAEAEAVYRESLKTYRDDGWALFGLAQALRAQGKTAEAETADKQFAIAWSRADVRLTSSRSPS